MQSIDRDTQIALMKNAAERQSAFVAEMLRVPQIRAAALKCAFEAKDETFTSKQVRVRRKVG